LEGLSFGTARYNRADHVAEKQQKEVHGMKPGRNRRNKNWPELAEFVTLRSSGGPSN
jgi:hypothetical protein